MNYLITGLVIFFGVHLISATPLREKLIRRIGENPYKGAFSLISLAGFALIILGMANAEYQHLWQPPAWAHLAPAILMAPALILMASANFANHIARIARHPMSCGVLLWAAAHLMANGELAAVLLFGSFAAYALFNICTGGRKKPAVSNTPAPSIKFDLLAVVIGAIAYIAFATFHQTLFGVPVV